MEKPNLPQTSKYAYKAVTPEMLSDHHAKILKALKRMGQANYEQIATYVNLDRHQVGRRISELERMELIYKPGKKSATSTGRSAYDYRLCVPGEENKTVIDKAIKKGKTVSDYSKSLIQDKLF
jgi:predicted transcriptional regulator